MMKKTILILTMIMMGIFLTACGPNLSPSQYSASQVGATGTVSRVIPAQVVSIRPVTIQKNTGIGGLAGVATGAAAGSAIGGSTEAHIVGGVTGAVIGGIAANAAEKSFSKKEGMEYVLKTKNGLLSVVQVPEFPIQVGDHVLLIYGETVRIIPDNRQEKA